MNSSEHLHIAVIIRFRNEVEYIASVLHAVRAQRVVGASIRVVGIDNGSSDGSRAIADSLCDAVYDIDEFMPGAALNLAIQGEACHYVAVVSAHAIPADSNWLMTLLAEASKPDTLGVYGAQIYPLYARFLDKRDLDIFSSPTPRLETRDSDFWNTNSMFPRSAWEKRPFDETVFELEDHHWTKCLLDGTNLIRFVPNAVVYHYSHDERNDRHLPHRYIPPDHDIETDLATLASLDESWPRTMMAALRIKTLRERVPKERAVALLVRLLHEHWDFDVRWRVADTLGVIPHADGIEALITALADPSFYARDEAAWALARLGQAAAERLIERLPGVPPREWPLAAMALGQSGGPDARRRAVELILDGLTATQGELRCAYLYAAGELEPAADLYRLQGILAQLLQCEDVRLRATAAWAAGALAQADDGIAWPAVVEAARDPDAIVRTEAVMALGKKLLKRPDGAIAAAVANAGADDSSRVRYASAQIARLLGGRGAELMQPAGADDPDYGVRFETAAGTLARMQH